MEATEPAAVKAQSGATATVKKIHLNRAQLLFDKFIRNMEARIKGEPDSQRRELYRAVLAVFRNSADTVIRADEALVRFLNDGGISPAGFENEADFKKREALLTACLLRNQEKIETHRRMIMDIRDAMAPYHYTPKELEEAAGAKPQAYIEKHILQFQRMRNALLQYGKVLEFYKENLGRWSLDRSGRVVMNSRPLEYAHKRLLERLAELKRLV